MDRLIQQAQELAKKSLLPILSIPKRIAYVVSHGQSYASNGYAIRTQGIAEALNAHGFETLCFVRPGRPWELSTGATIDPEVQVKGVRYIHTRHAPGLKTNDKLALLEADVAHYIELFQLYRPEVVLAASNYKTGLPALVAARRLGLAFHYEVRGFWEVSRASLIPSWRNTLDFEWEYEYETWVCNQADRLYTLNRFMSEELIKRGALSERIQLVPNAVRDIHTLPLTVDNKLKASLGIKSTAYVVGYVGSLTEYEGLDLLVQAIAKEQCKSVHALIVGSSRLGSNISQTDVDPIIERLMSQASELGVADRLTFTGRVSPDKLKDYFNIIDATVIPRHALPVCELVSAIKPLEYLSFGKPVIASDVAPQVDLLEGGGLGWLFSKGSVESLANAITSVQSALPKELERKIKKGQEVVKSKYLWSIVVQDMVSGLKGQPCVGTGLKVACIMDNFTYTSFSPEGSFFQLTPQCWEQELNEFKPDILFIESAWRGKDDLWGSKVGHKSLEVRGILSWCKQNHTPTVFWNKEDPVHFETFLSTAKLFDFIFTTDIDCIHRYKAALGHNNVFLLPFACQPILTNPVEVYQRKEAFCFAGAYYVRYPERTKDLEVFLQKLPKYKPLDIYDRNYDKNDPDYKFPDNYKPYIRGTLPFNKIDKAYKGYRYAINLNSIKQSQSMFARRVYELLGSNTITISNFSRGLRLMFGDLVLCSDNDSELVRRLEYIDSNFEYAEKLKLLGLRKILSEHTYHDRFNYILSKVNEEEHKYCYPSYTVVSFIRNDKDLIDTMENVFRQIHQPEKLVLVRSIDYKKNEFENKIKQFKVLCDVECFDFSFLINRSLRFLAKAGSWIAAFSPSDYYGSSYLLDMALATRFSDSPVIGKVDYYEAGLDGIVLNFSNSSYKKEVALRCRCAVLAPSMQFENASKWISRIDDGVYTISNQQAIDIFNYCLNGLRLNTGDLHGLKERVEGVDIDVGISLSEMQRVAERIKPTPKMIEEYLNYSADDLYGFFSSSNTKNTKINITDNGIKVQSNLGDGKHEYLYANSGKVISLKDFCKGGGKDGRIPLYFEVTPGLGISFVLIFFNSKSERLHHSIIQPNKNNQVNIPEGADTLRLGFRIYQSGECFVKNLLIGERDLSTGDIIGRSDVLLLTNHYPSYEDLYRNGFVHSRVKAYKEESVNVDVFRFRKDQAISWHEFQDVDVITGSKVALRRLLEGGQYRHVLVHFLDAEMWEVLETFVNEIKITVWVHGAEVQPWWRREYNYQTEIELNKAKKLSQIRLDFWRGILTVMPSNLTLVFVSQYFADEVMEDVGIKLPKEKYKIIHNPVDTDIFSYERKSVEQRKKVLSIRPYASRKYANDLSVKAVLELSKSSLFKDIEFLFIGDGILFEETLQPLRGFSNVTIQRGFLSQQDIAKLHKNYGVFLCPTRMDAQGVSKDEAMSSGLVVVTNAVTAIPEFIDSKSGILVDGEDYKGLSEAIYLLVNNPDLFSSLSSEAAARARAQVSKYRIIDQELEVFY